MVWTMLRTVLAVVVGYGVMVVLITLVQETWFGGIGWGRTPPGILLVAGLLTMLAASVGSLAATMIAGGHRYVPALVMSATVAVETTGLILTGKVPGPLWFEVLAAAALIVALFAGAWLLEMLTRLRSRHDAAAT